MREGKEQRVSLFGTFLTLNLVPIADHGTQEVWGTSYLWHNDTQRYFECPLWYPNKLTERGESAKHRRDMNDLTTNCLLNYWNIGLQTKYNNVCLSISRFNLLGRSFRRLAGRGVYCKAVLQEPGISFYGKGVTLVDGAPCVLVFQSGACRPRVYLPIPEPSLEIFYP